MPGDKGHKGQPGDIGFPGKKVCIILYWHTFKHSLCLYTIYKAHGLTFMHAGSVRVLRLTFFIYCFQQGDRGPKGFQGEKGDTGIIGDMV